MIKVLKSGVLLTIQDFGREGYRHLGVSKAGSLDPIAISTQDNLVEIERQEDTALRQLDGLPPTLRTAAIAQITANSQNAASQAVTAATRTNAQNQLAIDQANLQQSNAQEQADLNNLLNFEQRQLRALANTEADIDNFFEAQRRIRLQEFNFLQNRNLIESLISDFRQGQDGSIELDPQSRVQLASALFNRG